MKIKELFARLLYKVGNRLVKLSNRESRTSRFLTFAPAGHFYSPIPDEAFVDQHSRTLFADDALALPGIDMNASGQRQLLAELLKYSGDFKPATSADEAGNSRGRFYAANPFFKELDAYLYYGMLRRYCPKRIVEVGSGFTSALAVEVSERFLRPQPQFVFMDPYPERLRSLFRHGTPANVAIMEQAVQQADPAVFSQLEAGDFLFIDSTHVSKIGSDVNFLFFEVLPRLKKGVIVHVHDIFWPFEYPKLWLDEGRSWNEAYLLRGLLSDSGRYRILCASSYLARHHADLLKGMPGWVSSALSSSIWIEVVT